MFALVRSVDGAELERAFRAVTESLIAEIGLADTGLAGRLTGVLRELAGGPPSAESATLRQSLG